MREEQEPTTDGVRVLHEEKEDEVTTLFKTRCHHGSEISFSALDSGEILFDDSTTVNARLFDDVKLWLDSTKKGSSCWLKYNAELLHSHRMASPCIMQRYFIDLGAQSLDRVHLHVMCAWLSRLFALHNIHVKTMSLALEVEMRAIAGDAAAEFQDPHQLVCAFDPVIKKDDIMNKIVLFCLTSTSGELDLSVQARLTDKAIEIVCAWIQGRFDDVDDDREEVYSDGMLTTLCRSSYPSHHWCR